MDKSDLDRIHGRTIHFRDQDLPTHRSGQLTPSKGPPGWADHRCGPSPTLISVTRPCSTSTCTPEPIANPCSSSHRPDILKYGATASGSVRRAMRRDESVRTSGLPHESVSPSRGCATSRSTVRVTARPHDAPRPCALSSTDPSARGRCPDWDCDCRPTRSRGRETRPGGTPMNRRRVKCRTIQPSRRMLRRQRM